MSTLIQIRNVPDETHARLKERAAEAGKSLNSYMLEMLERQLEEDSILARREAVLRKHRNAPRRYFGPDIGELVRQDREEHEAADWARIEGVKPRDRS